MGEKSECAVLFVDDQMETLMAYRLYFQRKFIFLTAGDYEEALKILKKKRDVEIGVLLSDLQLSKKPRDASGLDLLKECARTRPEVVRLLITGHIESGVCVDAVNSGAVDRMIAKPCVLEELEKVLSRAVDDFLQGKKDGGV
ncbi:hypothetical protein EPICR_30122 [Candidatus Desulfarcum epimagneticum]|uniref:Response regulatory domain-containing protein n=1 Tax=uncultured Desulfobacteraceae bacterium TaxID=218296 RepID=A0A484HG00_9BACT|nr:hypothetical protein EPICR_30122 [uncultured Desulfobacteraceae bacterium]